LLHFDLPYFHLSAPMKLLGTLLAITALFVGASACAQSWPANRITLVVPFAAGSGTDAIARIISQKVSEHLGQQVIVDNRPGASAQIGTAFVAHAKPDGYTLLMGTNTTHSSNPTLFTTLSYDPVKDFTPIVKTGDMSYAVVASTDQPYQSMQQFIDYAKGHPGKLSYATPNSTSLVAFETIKRMAGIDVVGVNYKSSPQAMTDVVGHQVELYVTDFGSGLAMMKAEKVRVLAVTPAAGSKILPGIPSVGKTLPGFDLSSWNGIFGPAGLPRPVVDKLNTEFLLALADKDVQARLADIGFEVKPSSSPDQFNGYLADQLKLWTNLIRQAGIKPE
jgi:tripartite-type tricarboxylate transporter receptor subunit TctC